MKKNRKKEVIFNINKRFCENEAVFLVTQNKMTVAESEDLRKQLKGTDSAYFVSKNTLAKLAVKDTDFECILPYLKGQTALVFSKNITGTAKVISEYSSKSDGKIVILCGGYSGKLLSAGEVKILAQLPSMDELRAKIIAIIQTPAQRIATLLQMPAGQLARVLKGYSEKIRR